MLSKIKEALANDNELDSETLRILSLVFLLISGAISLKEHTRVGWLWDTSFTFNPDFISCIISIALIAPLYLRGVLKWNKSTYSLISFILILFVFSSFVVLALGGNDISTITITLLASAVILSWLGIRAVAGISWLLALTAAIYSAVENNLAMGLYGFIYIACGFIGLVLHSGLNPGQLLQELKADFSSTASKINSNAQQDIKITVDKMNIMGSDST